MTDNYRIKYKSGEFEVEVESTDKSVVLPSKVQPSKKTPALKKKPTSSTVTSNKETGVDIVKIINSINESEQHDIIKENILNKVKNLNKILLVFYFTNEAHGNNTYITTGNVEKITDQLGIKIEKTNIGKNIKKNLKYFSTENVRKKGVITKYKLNRKGIEEFKQIIAS
jgi:hypothetical protein